MEVVEALISAVEKREALYNQRDLNYSNRGFINKLWAEVAKEVDIDETAAKRKWGVLRDSFRKHHKLETAYKSGSSTKTNKRWYLYNRLLFLGPFMRETSSNLAYSPEEEEYNIVDAAASTSMSKTLEAAESSTPIAAHVSENSCVPPARKLKRKAKFPHERKAAITPVEGAILAAIRELREKRAEMEDDDEHFLRSLLPTLRKLDPITKLECRVELNATVLRYLRRQTQTQRQEYKTMVSPTPSSNEACNDDSC